MRNSLHRITHTSYPLSDGNDDVNADHVEGQENPKPETTSVDVAVSGDIQSRLTSLIDRGWAVEWERGDQVICHLILFSSRRVQGSGIDANSAARAAIGKLDAI
jgi:hypothetical protein